MADIKLEPGPGGQHAFNLYESSTKMGEMAVSLSDEVLTVYHTEVSPEAEGKGYAKQLLDAMTAYARQNHLMVVPLCPFVLAQFKKHREAYADIWKKSYGTFN